MSPNSSSITFPPVVSQLLHIAATMLLLIWFSSVSIAWQAPRNALPPTPVPPQQEIDLRSPLSNQIQQDPSQQQSRSESGELFHPTPVDRNQPLRSVDVPLQETPLPERTIVAAQGDSLTLVVRDASLNAVMNAIAEEMDLNIVSAGGVSGQISITLNQVPLDDALNAILSVNGYRWVKQNNIIMVSSLSGGAPLPPQVQGREVRVFQLNFASATDVDKTVQGLLSPVGQSVITTVESADKLRTREELMVEDLPEYLQRIEAYVAQCDRPPAQVLIEAHVLQVSLREENRNGVDLKQAARLARANVSLATNGIANAAAAPAFLLNIDGTDMDALVEIIKTTTDAKSLASPKLLAINGQEARIQIGQQLGYLTTTTTQTSTLQSVQFIDLGVVLTVTPVISRDGQVLMKVKPEVSSGRINPTTSLPEEETTEVETTVLLPSGYAMVIGGLIKEETSDQQSKLPLLGDVPVVGKLFQRRARIKGRNEIIIVLLPRIVPFGDDAQIRQIAEVQRATSPLVCGPLVPVDRRSVEAEIRDQSDICDPYGKPMSAYPSPPVAYSPFNAEGFQSIPLLPMETLPEPPAMQGLGEEFLPPATGNLNMTPAPIIQQTSATRGWKQSRSNAPATQHRKGL